MNSIYEDKATNLVRPRGLNMIFPSPLHPGLRHAANFFIGVVVAGLTVFHGAWSISEAQVISNITSDGSLPTPTEVNQVGNTFNIDGGTVVGTNQFQSLATFTVGTGDIASFNGPSGIANILSRITGGQQSVVDGNIRTTIPGANLYLLNPFGVLFGENASLDIGNSVGQPGSFYASTADVVYLSDGVGQFFTTLGEADVLTTASVAEFGFLTDNPAPIDVQGSGLAVGIDTTDPENPQGKTLALIGGDITISGDPNFVNFIQLSAPSGNVKLASLSGPGTVVDSVSGTTFQINAQENQGQVTVSDFAGVSASGDFVEGDGSGGTVYIRGGQLVVENFFANITADTQYGVDGAEVGIDIDVTKDVLVRNNGVIGTMSNDTGQSGDVNINARNVDVTGGSFIFTTGNGGGQPGDINVTASEEISVSGDDGFGSFSTIQSQASFIGDTGAITLSGSSATIDDQGIVQTFAIFEGNAGDITLDMSQDVNVTGGGVIESRASGIGTTGNITITAGDTVTISGQFDDFNPSRVSNINDFADGGGENGDISIFGRAIILSDNAKIENENDAGLFGGKIEFSASESLMVSNNAQIRRIGGSSEETGVELSAPTITFDQGNLLSRTRVERDAGNTTMSGATLNFLNGSTITSDTLSESGQGGDITINASDSVFISEGSTIRSNSESPATGSGGQVSVNAVNTVSISGANSGLLTETSGLGNGGAVNVQGKQVQLSNGATISANSTSTEANAGNSGGVTIAATDTFQSDNSTVSTSAQEGQGGNIEITAGQNVELMNDSTVLAESFGPGNSGTVTMTAMEGNFQSDNSRVSTTAQEAEGGAIIIAAGQNVDLMNTSTVLAESSGPGEEARGGDITITAGENLQLTNDTTISAESSGAGDSGAVTMTAMEGNFQSENSTVSTSAQVAQGGDIQITAGQNVEMMNDSTVLAESFGPGNSGTVTMTAMEGNFQSDNSTVSTSAQEGQGGDINISSAGNVELDETIISAESSGPGDAGDITVSAGNDINMLSSTISTEAQEASGGNIKLAAAGLFIEITDSRIESSVRGAENTQGGNIDLDPNFILIQSSQILANAIFGDGGNITLTATDAVFISADSIIDASSQFGSSGTVTVNSPTAALAEVAAVLPKNFVIPKSLFADACAAQAGGKFSSFTQGAPAAIPPAPGGFLSSPLMLNNLTTPPSTGGLTQSSTLAQSRLGLDMGLDFSTIPLLPAQGCIG